MRLTDATGVGTIVDDDARVPVPVSVSSVTVNEKSSYAVFTVSAEPGSVLDLSTSPGTATAGSMMSAGDYANSIQFWNGSAWITTTVFNATPTADANGTLKVRVGITDDNTSDSGETFTLQATYRNNATNTTLGVAIGSSATGTGTIVDDGTGSYWNSNVDPLTPATDPVVGPTIDPLHPLADDDRTVTIDDQTVNEASPYAVQTITGNAGQYVRLVLDVTGTGTGHALVGSDYTNALEYWNGNAWTVYTAGSYIKMPAATMQVRVAILNDGTLENNETYQITVYNTGGAADVGTVTIADDGSGKKWSFSGPNDPGSAPAVGPGPGFDDERALTINGFTVNEKSPYGVFTVAGVAGQYVTLNCADGTAAGGVDYSTSLQYLNGSTWQTYTAGSHVQVQSNGLLRVRTAIVDDASYEMSESLTLTAANTSGMAVTATGTIVDDGQGDYFGPNDPTPNPNPPTPLDDDRPRNPAFVDDLTVNEGSPFVVFTVTGVPTADVTLSLSDGTALAGTDYTNSLQYWSGSAWTAYNSSTPPALGNDGKLLVRAPVLQDNSNEPDESLQLSVQYTGTRNVGVTSLVPDTSNTFTGTAWIVDDGNGNFFPEAEPNNNVLPPLSPYNPATDPVVGPTLDPTRPLPDDERVVTVNDITVNEASPYAVFTVSGFEGQYVKLLPGTGTATAGSDYTAALEYWNGSAWAPYISDSYVAIPADSDATANEVANLLVRVAITNDGTPDNGETFTLTAFNTGGASDLGTCTIVDDGLGKVFPNLNGRTRRTREHNIERVSRLMQGIVDDVDGDRPCGYPCCKIQGSAQRRCAGAVVGRPGGGHIADGVVDRGITGVVTRQGDREGHRSCRLVDRDVVHAERGTVVVEHCRWICGACGVVRKVLAGTVVVDVDATIGIVAGQRLRGGRRGVSPELDFAHGVTVGQTGFDRERGLDVFIGCHGSGVACRVDIRNLECGGTAKLVETQRNPRRGGHVAESQTGRNRCGDQVAVAGIVRPPARLQRFCQPQIACPVWRSNVHRLDTATAVFQCPVAVHPGDVGGCCDVGPCHLRQLGDRSLTGCIGCNFATVKQQVALCRQRLFDDSPQRFVGLGFTQDDGLVAQADPALATVAEAHPAPASSQSAPDPGAPCSHSPSVRPIHRAP